MTKTTKLLVGLGILVLLAAIVFMQYPGTLRTIGVSVWTLAVVGAGLTITGVLTALYNKFFGNKTISTVAKVDTIPYKTESKSTHEI